MSVARLAWRKFQDDDVTVRAMALTYTTILSLVPFLAVAFSVLKAFGIQNQIEPLLGRIFAPLGAEASELSRRIVDFVNNMRVGVLGVLGVAGLLYTVISLIGTIEASLNRIWRVTESRSWADQFRDYLSAVMVGPVLIFTALGLTASAQSSSFVQGVLALVPSFVMVLATSVLPFVLLSLAFTLLYRLLPNTRVSLRAAAIGGVVAGVGWKLSGTAFAAFVAGSGSYAAIYSGFAILVLFLIWIYLSWTIALAGAEVAYLVDHLADERRLRRREHFEGWAREALRLLVFLAERREAGLGPVAEDDLVRALDLPPDLVRDLAARFAERRIVLVSAQPPGLALAVPPRMVQLADALEVAAPAAETARPVSAAVADVLRRRHEAGLRAIEGSTLQDLVPAVEVPARQAS